MHLIALKRFDDNIVFANHAIHNHADFPKPVADDHAIQKGRVAALGGRIRKKLSPKQFR